MTLFSCPDFSLIFEIDLFFSLIESKTSPHIFSAKEERLSLSKWTVKILFLVRTDAFLRWEFLLVNSNKEFDISEEILLLGCQISVSRVFQFL